MLKAIAIYVFATLAANYTATWFFPLPVFGMVAVGTLVFGVTFTQRDRVHRYGRRWVYGMLGAAALLNLLASLVLDIPLRIVVASFITILLAEAADTEVYQRLIRRPWLVRVAGSNAVSIPLDSALFNLLAFGGEFALPLWLSVVFGEIVVKATVGMVTALWRQNSSIVPAAVRA